jgi:hypothetical protein
MLAHGTFSRRGGGIPIYYWFLSAGVWTYERGLSQRGGSYRGAFWFWFYGGVKLKFLLANFF